MLFLRFCLKLYFIKSSNFVISGIMNKDYEQGLSVYHFETQMVQASSLKLLVYDFGDADFEFLIYFQTFWN